MLQESKLQNQAQDFNQFKIGLSDLIKTNSLAPKEANILFLVYGDRLQKENEKLYRKLGGLAISYEIMETTKIRLNHDDISHKSIAVVLKYYGPIIKIFEPELYDQLKKKC